MSQVIQYVQLSLFAAFIFSSLYLVFTVLTEKTK